MEGGEWGGVEETCLNGAVRRRLVWRGGLEEFYYTSFYD